MHRTINRWNVLLGEQFEHVVIPEGPGAGCSVWEIRSPVGVLHPAQDREGAVSGAGFKGTDGEKNPASSGVRE